MPAEPQSTDSAAPSCPVETDEFNVEQLHMVTVGHAAHDVYPSALAPLLPLFIVNMGLSKTGAGFLTLLSQAPSVLQPALGHAADRFNLRYIMLLTPALSGLATCLVGLAPNYAVLALLLVLAGISSAGFHSVAPALAGRLAGRRDLGRGMSLWMLGGEAGYAVGPLLVATTVQWLGLRGTPVLVVVGVFGSVILMTRLHFLPPAPPTAEVDREVPWWTSLGKMAPVMLPMVAVLIVRSFAMSALSSFLPTFLSEAGTGLWLAGVSLTIYQIAASCGVLVGGTLSDRLGRRMVMLASMILTPLALFAFLWAHGALQFLCLLGIGAVVSIAEPVALAIIQENFPESRAMSTGLYLTLEFIIRSLAVIAVGAAGDWRGLPWAYAASGIVFLLGTPFVFLLPNKRTIAAAS